MDCQETQKYLYAYFDGQLGLKESVDVEDHLSSCPDCQQRAEFEQRFTDLLRQQVPSWHAPETLKKNIQHNLKHVHAQNSFWTAINVFALAKPVYALVVGLVLLSTVIYLHYHDFLSHAIIRETVADHIRYLLAESPTETSASDADDIESWFEKKLEFALNIPHFKENVVDLLGAKLTYFLERRVAHMLYDVQKHTVSLYILKGSDITMESDKKAGDQAYYEEIHQGFTVVGWRKGEYIYCFVSDVGHNALENLALEAMNSVAEL